MRCRPRLRVRFDDHRSFFTMASDHKHDLISEAERNAVYAFMAGTWRARSATSEVSGLPAAVRAGLFAA